MSRRYKREQIDCICDDLRGHGLSIIPCAWYRRGHKEGGTLQVMTWNLVDICKYFKHPIFNHKGNLYKVVPATIDRVQFNFYQVHQEYEGAMLLFLTGNEGFNMAIRIYAKKQDFKLDQYGLWKFGDRIAGRTEQQIFYALGIEYLPPEQRDFGPKSIFTESTETQLTESLLTNK